MGRYGENGRATGIGRERFEDCRGSMSDDANNSVLNGMFSDVNVQLDQIENGTGNASRVYGG